MISKLLIKECYCGENKCEIIYNGPIRSGAAGNFANVSKNNLIDSDSGNYTKNPEKIVRCLNCNLVSLFQKTLANDFYQSKEYREKYNNTHDIDHIIDLHKHEQLPRFTQIGDEMIRDKVVLDNGCGHGGFLDFVKDLTKKRVAIEPTKSFHKSLSERGNDVYSNAEEAMATWENAIDTVISTGVIEHVDDPLMYLKDSYALLKKGGSIFIETDNLDDILCSLDIEEFKKFYYRTVHLWYFNYASLENLLQKAGFENIEVSFQHTLDFSNYSIWLKDRKPSGTGKIDQFDKGINQYWKTYLESKGQSDLVCITAQKK